SVRGLKGAALICGALLLIATVDHALNVLVVRGANLSCAAAVRRVAAFCDQEMASGSLLPTHAHHSYEIGLWGRNRFTCYFTSMTGSSKALRVQNAARLAALLAKIGDRNLYCLDARLPARTGQLGASRVHWVMRDDPVEMVDYGEIDRVSYKYPV